MKYRLKNPFPWLKKPNLSSPMTDLEGGTNVSERFRDYISRSISAYYRKRVLFPLLYLLLLVALLFASPTRSMLFPRHLEGGFDITRLYQERTRYVNVEMHDLYFTGYIRQFMGLTTGYYYYTVIDDRSVLVLLKPDTSSQGLEQISSVRFASKIMRSPDSLDRIRLKLREDFPEAENLSSSLSSYMLSEPDARGILHRLLILFIWISGIYSLLRLSLDLLYIFLPRFSAPVRKLAMYGDPRSLLAQAEEELATMPQLATEDIFITEHFFIETSLYGVAIVPISEIRWIYKYSTLYRILWHHFSISYTLYIMTSHRQAIHCPKNTKSDIDGVMDYLTEANHDIMQGFTEENRQEMQRYLRSLPLTDLIPFLRKSGKEESNP